jgi:hypothetical protein
MKRVIIIIELILLFLILTQSIVFSFHLINQPDTISLISGLILFGVQIFGIIVLVNYTYQLIVEWKKQSEIVPEEVPTEEIETETPKKKKEKNLKPKKDE